MERYMWVLGLAPWGWGRMLVRVRAPLDLAWGPELAVPHPRHFHCWSWVPPLHPDYQLETLAHVALSLGEAEGGQYASSIPHGFHPVPPGEGDRPCAHGIDLHCHSGLTS